MDLAQALEAGLVTEGMREPSATAKGSLEVLCNFFQWILQETEDSMIRCDIYELSRVGITNETPIGAEIINVVKEAVARKLVYKVDFTLKAYLKWKNEAIREDFVREAWPTAGSPPVPVNWNYVSFSIPCFLGLAVIALDEVEGDPYFKEKIKEHLLCLLQDSCETYIDITCKGLDEDPDFDSGFDI